MGDFFTRLAERTLGLAPVVQPDLMPLLPPLAESEVVSDALPGLEPSRDGVTVRAIKAAPPQQADWLGRNIATTETAARAENVPQSSTQDWQQRVAGPAWDGGAVDGQSEPSVNESPRPMARAAQSVVEVESSYRNPEFTTGEQTTSAEMRQSPHASAGMAQTKPSEVKPTTPTIQISIGRVEIRAVTPAPGSQRPAERRGALRLSLEEYLRQRNEGRR